MVGNTTISPPASVSRLVTFLAEWSQGGFARLRQICDERVRQYKDRVVILSGTLSRNGLPFYIA